MLCHFSKRRAGVFCQTLLSSTRRFVSSVTRASRHNGMYQSHFQAANGAGEARSFQFQDAPLKLCTEKPATLVQAKAQRPDYWGSFFNQGHGALDPGLVDVFFLNRGCQDIIGYASLMVLKGTCHDSDVPTGQNGHGSHPCC